MTQATIDRAALRRAVPPLAGALAVPGLDAPVVVHRDAEGVPHIRAGGEADAWFALGFVHAQDRLFQMDLNRRRALGRAAEFLGVAAADGDALARRLGVAAASRRDFALLGDAARAMLEAYARGVNGFLDSGAPPAIEYRLLEAVPERWEAWHAIAVMRRLGLLMGSVWFKLWRAAALPVVGAAQIGKLRHDDGDGDALILPPGAETTRWVAALAELAPAIAALARDAAPDVTGGGSNNWALGPSRTASGRPLLAGDPHRVFEIPNMYAQAHLACDAFDAIGLTVPGVPGFPHFGHNGRVAWCVTHAFADIYDLYVERFDDGARHALFQDNWEAVTRRTEHVAIRGVAEPRAVEIVGTRHGPVICGDPARGTALALRSPQLTEPDRTFDCLPRMLRADGVPALHAAMRGWGLIDHNLVSGDTAGRIGYLLRATVPRRRSRAGGWLPVPGWTGAYEWDGCIPFDELPCVIDPPGGVLVTANNRVVADDHPDYLGTDCHPSYRARRIAALLEAGGSRTPEAAAAVHGDTLSANALLFQAALRRLAPPGAEAAALRARILDWDARMDAGSRAAGEYVALRRALTAVLAERSGLGALTGDALLAVPPGVAPVHQLWWCLPALLRADDVALLGGWSWAEALGEALRRAAAGPVGPAWGETHRPRFAHPLSATFPDAAALLDPPSLPVGGDTDTVLVNGMLANAATPAASYGALARYAFDVGDWDRSLWCVFHGASGHPGSEDYVSQHAAWAACAMTPMLYGWDAVRAAARATLVLSPVAGDACRTEDSVWHASPAVGPMGRFT